ncbi:uncharacterized protein LOC127853577 isoform X2 [Dreissena polymorpha]|uniref:uncharacterized protein LOC127853577 isoform X2 n=1 Tax=Dreissena polymorpha TaxID=45954 RepID=UPI0022643C33|nr:uncharacterized protein LOC127853577 isoform X2 [Dreissena polymorpha]
MSLCFQWMKLRKGQPRDTGKSWKFSAFYLKIDSDKGKAKLKCATVSKVNADHESKKQKCETVSKTETCVYIEEDEEEDETRASPQKVIPASAWPVFSKSVSMATTARPDSATPGATCSHTMETSGPSIETLKKPEIATGIAECTGPKHLSQSPAQLIQVRKESPSDWWDGELQPSRSNDVSRSQAVKEMADYYAMMERKHSRQKAASDRMLNKLRDQSIQSVQKTVVYTEHGGISYSFKVNRDSTIKDVYDRVCQLVPSEILPAKFVLHSRAGEEYDIMSEKVIEETPPVLFLKEQKMDNLNDTLTNFEEVFF